MAVPWLVVLQNIPWKDVIVNAPKVADEAKRFWTTIRRDPTDQSTQSQKKDVTEDAVVDHDPTLTVMKLKQKTQQLEESVADMHEQLLESSALIKALADQNEVLVKHIEINRSRIKLVSIILAVFVIAFIVAILHLQGVV